MYNFIVNYGFGMTNRYTILREAAKKGFFLVDSPPRGCPLREKKKILICSR